MPPERRRKPRTVRQARTLSPAVTYDRVEALRRLAGVLNAQQLQIAVWYYVDGFDMPQIAEWLGVTKIAVAQRLERIDRYLEGAGLPRPRRLEHPFSTKHTESYEVYDD